MAEQQIREIAEAAFKGKFLAFLLRSVAALLVLANTAGHAELFRLNEDWRSTATSLLTPAEAVGAALAMEPADPCDAAAAADCTEAPAGQQWIGMKVGDQRLLEELARSIRIRLPATAVSDPAADLTAVFAAANTGRSEISAQLSGATDGMYRLTEDAQESVAAWIHDNLEAADAGQIVIDRLEGVDEGADVEVTVVAKEGSFGARG